MKRFFAAVFLLAALSPLQAFAQQYGSVNYDELYNNQPVLSFKYDENEDPQEITDYEKRVKSPYPLLRVSIPLQNRKITVKPGYYLLTPRDKDGYDFVMFKQNGKIVHEIPVYQKEKIDPEVIYPKPPKQKHPIYTWPLLALQNTVKWIYRDKLPPPPPRYIVKTSLTPGHKYFEIYYYHEEYLYKMIFIPVTRP